MISSDFLRLCARYNRWMNERIYAVCTGIPDAERRRDRGAFFRSIHGTLNHLLLADRIWLARFRHEDFEIRSLDEELYADWDELCRERGRTDAEIASFLGSLGDEQLAAPFAFTSFVNPQRRVFPLWVLVTHFLNHQTHHRGQLTTLLSQAGLDYGVTDLIWLPGADQGLSTSGRALGS